MRSPGLRGFFYDLSRPLNRAVVWFLDNIWSLSDIKTAILSQKTLFMSYLLAGICFAICI
jgi:hypothetical protein